MKVDRKVIEPPFAPVVITIESREELNFVITALGKTGSPPKSLGPVYESLKEYRGDSTF